MSTLTVVCPNARRIQIKVAPMMLLKQVLAEACLKSGFDCENHELKSLNKKSVDLSLPFRLSGLANNSTLDMVPRTSTATTTLVEIALQLPSGSRQQLSFSTSSTLWNMLEKFGEKFAENLTTSISCEVPCCAYMNRQYAGQAELQSTTLSSLGISSGKSLIRFSRVKLSDEKLKELAENVKQESARKAALDVEFSRLKAENEERERLEKQRQEEFEKEAAERERKRQEEERARPEPMDQSEVQRPSGRDVLQDVRPQDPNAWSFDGNVFARQESTRNYRLEELNQLLERVNSSLTTSGPSQLDELVNVVADRGRVSVSQLMHPAPQSQGASNDTGAKPDSVAPIEPCDRKTVIFRKVVEQEDPEPMEVSDDFYEVRAEDLKNMQKDLRQQVRESTQAALLPKSFILARNRNGKLAAYCNTVVRVDFGEYVLQALFRSAEPSSRLLDLMLSLLGKNASLNFFCTNIRLELTDTKNFVEIDLAPKTTVITRLTPEQLTEISSKVVEVDHTEADRISSEWLSANTVFKPFVATVAEDQRIAKRQSEQSDSRATVSGFSGPPPAKSSMPKWMNVGKR